LALNKQHKMDYLVQQQQQKQEVFLDKMLHKQIIFSDKEIVSLEVISQGLFLGPQHQVNLVFLQIQAIFLLSQYKQKKIKMVVTMNLKKLKMSPRCMLLIKLSLKMESRLTKAHSQK